MESKKMIQMNSFKKQRVTDFKNKFMVSKGKGRGRGKLGVWD